MRRFITIAVLPILMMGAAMVFSLSPQTPAPRPADLSAMPQIEVGDWVLRMGTVADSHLIRHLSGGDYSHIGMVVATKPQIMVIHATTDDGTALNRVQLTPLSEFFSPDLAQAHAVVRPKFLDKQQNQAIAKRLLARRGEDFVLAARDQPHLYCTTLLADEIRRIQPTFTPAWQQVNAPLMHGEYLFPQAFSTYPDIQTIYRIPQ